MGMNYYTTLAYHWLDNIPEPKTLPEWPSKIPEPTPEQVEKLSAEGYVVVGDPDDCARSVQRWVDIGFDQLTFSPTTNTLPTEVVVGVDGAVRPRGHPAVRHGPRALDHALPPGGGAAASSAG